MFEGFARSTHRKPAECKHLNSQTVTEAVVGKFCLAVILAAVELALIVNKMFLDSIPHPD